MNINRPWKRWMAVGCSHGSHIDPRARAAVLAFKRDFDPERRIHLGDYHDAAAFRAGAKGTNDETANITDDLTAMKSFLWDYAPTDLINGNHDDRLWKLADHYNAVIARAAQSAIGEIRDVVESLPCRHIDHYHINRSWLQLGNFRFLHGFMYNEQAIRDHAEHFGNCVIAHLHKVGEATGRRSDHPVAYCVGTLARIDDMDYAKTRRATAAWSQGLAYGEYTEDECTVNLERL